MIIPMGFAAAGITLLVKGIDDLSWGKNRKEGFSFRFDTSTRANRNRDAGFVDGSYIPSPV